MSTFAGNVLKLVTGIMIAQGLGVLVAPVITRLFAPEAFGVAALFTSLTGIIGAVVCLRYELSIMLPKTDEEASNLLGLSLFFVLIITGISALTIFFAGDVIAGLLNSPELNKYLWLVPVSVFVSGTFLALNYWNSRTKNFGRLSIARVVSSVANQTTKMGAGFAGFVSGGVLIGTGILGQVISTFVLGWQIWRDDRRLFKANIQWEKMIVGLKRHKRFPIYNTWAALLNTASQHLPAIMLAFYFSPKVVGFYALGKIVLSMPISLVGGAVSQVFFQKASEAYNRTGNLSKIVEEVFKRLVSLGIFPILLLTLIGEDLFIVVFGQRWAEAGLYTQVLSIYMCFNLIAAPLGQLFSVLERQEVTLLVNILLFLFRFGALWFGGQTGDIIFTLCLFSLSGVLIYGGYSMWILHVAGLPLYNWWSSLFRSTFISGTFIGLGWLVCFSLGLNSYSTLVVYFLCAILYYIWIVRNDYQLLNLLRGIRPIVKEKVNEDIYR